MKSSNIQVGDLIIVEKVSLYVYLLCVKYFFRKTIENEVFLRDICFTIGLECQVLNTHYNI